VINASDHPVTPLAEGNRRAWRPARYHGVDDLIRG
jgi:hypothetical protein